jgi:hypothetical protein
MYSLCKCILGKWAWIFQKAHFGFPKGPLWIFRAKAYQQKLLKRLSGKSKNTKCMIESTKVHTFCDGSSHKTPEWGFGGHMADRNAFKNSDW